MREYHDLYLYTDVLALADCMMTLREGWWDKHGLDMFQSLTLPGASQAALLRRTGARVELITETNGGIELMDKVNANIRRSYPKIVPTVSAKLERGGTTSYAGYVGSRPRQGSGR